MRPADLRTTTRAESPAANRLADPTQMRDLLPFRLNQLVAVAGAPVTRWCEGRFGISRRQWRVISALAEDGPLLSSQLAQRLELDRARTSRALGQLQAKQLIERHAMPGNARQVMVSVTALGRSTFEQLWPLLRQHHLSLLAAFTPQQVQALDEMLVIALRQARQISESYTDLPKADRRSGAGIRHQGQGGVVQN